jgi:hypothetical protein
MEGRLRGLFSIIKGINGSGISHEIHRMFHKFISPIIIPYPLRIENFIDGTAPFSIEQSQI